MKSLLAVLLPGLIPAIAAAAVSGAGEADPLVERGRYLSKVAGCNDCHTAGYAQKNGEIPEKDWLTGDGTGWRGPWGTTYAINLRLFMPTLSEDQWLVYARNKPSRPPMPWYVLRDMNDADLRALYRFVRQLGPAGASAPGYVPPDQEPVTPYIAFVPQPPAAAGSATPAPAPASKPAEKTEEKSKWWDLDFKPARPRTERPGQ